MSRRISDSVSVPFSYVNNTNGVSGLLTLSVSPLLTPRLTSLADDFDEYRFTKLSFRILPKTSVTDLQCASFTPGIVDTAPALISAQSETIQSIVKGIGQTCPTDWVHVPQGVLHGMHSWYKSVAGTPESAEEVQGQLFVRTSAGDTTAVLVEIRGVCEFRAAIDTGSTPLDRALARRRREKMRIMNALATPDTPDARTGVLPPVRGGAPPS